MEPAAFVPCQTRVGNMEKRKSGFKGRNQRQECEKFNAAEREASINRKILERVVKDGRTSQQGTHCEPNRLEQCLKGF